MTSPGASFELFECHSASLTVGVLVRVKIPVVPQKVLALWVDPHSGDTCDGERPRATRPSIRLRGRERP